MIEFVGIDEKKTIKNVIHFLKRYRVYVLRAGRNITDLHATNLNGVHTKRSNQNNADARILERVQAEQIISETIRVMACLDLNSKLIIQRLFIDETPSTNTETAIELNVERTKYNRLKHLALLSFAEAYRLKDLRIFDDIAKER